MNEFVMYIFYPFLYTFFVLSNMFVSFYLKKNFFSYRVLITVLKSIENLIVPEENGVMTWRFVVEVLY